MYSPPIPLASDHELQLKVSADSTHTVVVRALVSNQLKGPPVTRILGEVTHVAGDRAEEVFEIPMVGGFLWGFSLFSRGELKRGSLYVEVFLSENASGVKLASGYVYDGHDLRDGEFGSSVEGPGKMVTNYDAASTQTSTFTVPANARWKIHGAWAENRSQASTKVAVSLQDGSNNVYHREVITSEADGTDDLNTSGLNMLKGMTLLEGHDLLVKVVTFTASDDTEKGALVEEWIEI